MENNNLEQTLKLLKANYLKKLESLSEYFAEQIENIQNVDIIDLHKEVHKISGTCGMYGLTKLSNMSTELELFLNEVKNNNIGLSNDELKDRLLNFQKSIYQTVKEEGDNKGA